MSTDGAVVVVGGTRGLGEGIARHYAGQGDEVIVTGRDPDRTASVAASIGGRSRGIVVDLARPRDIAPAFADVGPVRSLVIAAMERDQNSIREFDVDRALGLVTTKLVSYTEIVHVLLDRLDEESAILLFGGMAKERPYPGSTTVTTVNGGVVGLVRTMATELAPIRVNAIHPGIVADTPFWAGKSLDHVLARTPTGRFVTTADIVDAARFLLENRAVNAVDLRVDGGWIIL